MIWMKCYRQTLTPKNVLTFLLFYENMLIQEQEQED